MSRTDVHAPAWVKERDPAWRAYTITQHDHTKTGCDLTEFVNNPTTPYDPNGCRYAAVYIGRQVWCGCPMCDGQAGKRRQRRIERAAWRRTRRRLLQAADPGDVDVAPPPRSRGWW